MSLRDRETRLTEAMDDPACDRVRLTRTYGQFAAVNALVAGWRGLYVRHIRPLQRAATREAREIRVLDLGAGGGDVARALATWARADGTHLVVTAADPDARAIEFARRRHDPDVVVRHIDSAGLLAEGATFDIVVSNHVLHHLSSVELAAFLADSAALAPRVVHNDLRRSRIAYAAFDLATLPIASGSFLHQDGLLSIRRSYRVSELRAVVPEGWSVSAGWPFRVHLTRGLVDGAGRRS